MRAILLAATLVPIALAVSWSSGPATPMPTEWNSRAASGYLAGRAGTAPCLSCHTTFPYALARPYLASQGLTVVDKRISDSVTDRVNRWAQIQPYFTDKNSSQEQITNARGGEAVLNALVLLQRDRGASGTLKPDTKKALDIMWGLQIQTGPNAGAWPWFRLGNEPWEADDSQFWGTTLVSVVAAWSPMAYPASHQALQLARAYVQRGLDRESLLNQANALWMDGITPMLTSDQRKQVAARLLAKRQADGGWSASSLAISGLRRHDGTSQSTESDGYATALAILALEKTSSAQEIVAEARTWLIRHQRQDGAWEATSLNAKRDPSTDVGHFMTDAATSYAVMALAANEHQRQEGR